MSQDSNSGYNLDPEKPYDVPSTYETPLQPPYDLPSTYEALPQMPYGEPPPIPNETPQQYSYSTPQYGTSGTPVYNSNHSSYEASAPLPLSEAIRQLPNQYINVLTKPSSSTFAAEMGKASWNILWVQLISYAAISAIFGYLQMLTNSKVANYNTSGSADHQLAAILQVITQGTTFGAIIITPAFFFLWQGIIYLIAKAFDGNGTFLRQGYNSLLISVPISFISSVLGLIPGLGGLLGIGLGTYGIILQIFSLMAVHHFSGGKATAVFFISLLVLFVIAFVLGIILALAIAPTIQ